MIRQITLGFDAEHLCLVFFNNFLASFLQKWRDVSHSGIAQDGDGPRAHVLAFQRQFNWTHLSGAPRLP